VVADDDLELEQVVELEDQPADGHGAPEQHHLAVLHNGVQDLHVQLLHAQLLLVRAHALLLPRLGLFGLLLQLKQAPPVHEPAPQTHDAEQLRHHNHD